MLEAVNLTYKLLNDANPSANGTDACEGMRVFTSPMGPKAPSGCTAATNSAHTIDALAERCVENILSRDF